MKVEEIIDGLLRHDVTRVAAISAIKEIVDNLRTRGSMKMEVEAVYHTTVDDRLHLDIKSNYGGYSKVRGIKKGDSVYVDFN